MSFLVAVLTKLEWFFTPPTWYKGTDGTKFHDFYQLAKFVKISCKNGSVLQFLYIYLTVR